MVDIYPVLLLKIFMELHTAELLGKLIGEDQVSINKDLEQQIIIIIF
jgi:hypothetical protein